MTPIKLTAKQEAFAQAIADGMGQASAYRLAYDADNMKDDSVYQNASKLMKNAKIAPRIEQLKDELAEQALWSRVDSVMVLREIASKMDRDAKPNDRVAAVKALNAMHGFDAPTTLSVDVRSLTPIKDEDWL